MNSQTNILHRRERNSDAAAQVLHELLNLMEVSKIGTEASLSDDTVHWSSLCAR